MLRDSASSLANSKEGARYPSIPSSIHPEIISTSLRLPMISTNILNKTAESLPPEIATNIRKGEPSECLAFLGKLI